MAFKGITAWLLGNSSGGGEPGTNDYQALENKPAVNGHTLLGNQTSEQLGIPNVVANPEEEATDNLEKVTIGNDTYSIPTGGVVGTYNNENLSII